MKLTVKVVAICLLLFTLTAVSASASEKGSIRLGLEFGNPLAVIIIRPAPFDFKIGYDFSANPTLFLSADYRIISGYQIIDFLHLFLGVGAFTLIHFDPTEFDLGARIPIGLQAFLIDNVLEIFLEVAPTIFFLPSPIHVGSLPAWQGYFGFTILVPKFWK